jgi:hypothetical protein
MITVSINLGPKHPFILIKRAKDGLSIIWKDDVWVNPRETNGANGILAYERRCGEIQRLLVFRRNDRCYVLFRAEQLRADKIVG